MIITDSLMAYLTLIKEGFPLRRTGIAKKLGLHNAEMVSHKALLI